MKDQLNFLDTQFFILNSQIGPQAFEKKVFLNYEEGSNLKVQFASNWSLDLFV
jgi:hypothetical protein